MQAMNPILALERQCFFIGPQPFHASNGLPKWLPFQLGVHPLYAIPRLVMNEVVSSALDRAYALGSMLSTPLGESSLATTRMQEMIHGLTTALGRNLEGCSMLEVGAGSGGLMAALRDKGADVTGVEIGPQGKIGAERYGLRIVEQPFAAGLFEERFDAIYSYGCLEHLDDLDEFFVACRASLKEGGLMFHSVPNSAPLFEAGNLAHLAHEHINYFSPENGARLFESQGFTPAGAKVTKAGNELMLWGTLNSTSEPRWPSHAVASETVKLAGYARRLYDHTARVQEHLAALFDSGDSIGFYAGGYEYGFRMDGKNIRYFDGDAYKHGLAWLAGLPTIEAPEALVRDPVDHLVIFKPHYFNTIVEKLEAMNIGQTRFVNIASLMEGDQETGL